MEHHPLTPMTDANLVRVLSRQTDGTVGLVPFATVEQGAMAIRQAMTALKEQGRRYAIVDAVTDAHLVAIGEAAEHHALITGGSGVAMGLPANFRRAGLLPERDDAGCAAACVGSRRGARRLVLARDARRSSAWRANMCRCWNSIRCARPTPPAWSRPRATGWRTSSAPRRSSSPPRRRRTRWRRCSSMLGRDGAGALIEQTLAHIAEDLVARGVRRLVVAGGETAGAVVSRLGVRSLRIGGEIDPGVPWTYAEGGATPLLLALKSGNFGARDFFLKAFEVLAGR